MVVNHTRDRTTMIRALALKANVFYINLRINREKESS